MRGRTGFSINAQAEKPSFELQSVSISKQRNSAAGEKSLKNRLKKPTLTIYLIYL